MKFTKWLVIVCAVCLAAGCTRTEKIQPRPIDFTDAAGAVRVMTFNIRYGLADDGDNGWHRRRELVFDVPADHAADVIGLQEALNFQIKEIKQALEPYAVISAGRNDGRYAGEACPILYRSDRFAALDSGTFWFSNTPWKPGSKHWGNTLPRICTWVRLREIATGASFYVYNLHLDHASQSSREHSVELLAKEIARREHPDPVIVMGDFNMDTDNPAMAPLLARTNGAAGLVDVWSFLHSGQLGITTFHGFGQQPAGPCLDHILIGQGAAIIEVAVDARDFDGRYPSDHFPVIAYLRIL